MATPAAVQSNCFFSSDCCSQRWDPVKGNGRVQSGMLAGPLNLRLPGLSQPAKQGSWSVTCKSGGTQKQAGSALRAKAKKGSDSNPDEYVSDDQLQSFDRVETFLNTLKWDKNGLVAAIAQNVDTGAILMQGFANRDAISATIASRRATFFSRSRSQLWTKGESSNNFIHIQDISVDCDRDSIIYLGQPDGPTCHTGAETCYYTSVPQSEPKLLASTLYALEDLIAKRKTEEVAPGSKPSWTRRLLQDPKLLCSKIREEASELCQTLEASEGRERTVSEMADVLYHSMVLLSVQDVKMEEVMATLRKRFGQSGIEEKSKRPPKPSSD